MDLKEQVQDHETRIQTLEVKEATGEVRFESLCKRLDDLITVIKWFIGITVATIPIGLTIIEMCIK